MVFSANGQYDWMQTHASVPVAEHIVGDTYRIYFSTRDKDNRSYTSFIVVDLNSPSKILDIASSPVLAPGELGCFDDSGSMATWLVDSGEKKYMYYIGWNLGVTVPFRNAIGLATSDSDSGVFVRVASGPILDRSATEPQFCASCCVLIDDDKWHMWYLSCTDWRIVNGSPVHRYHLKYACSSDGIDWHRDGHVAIDFEDESEYAISRPSVIKDDDCWRMWFSSRGDAYRIRYAESEDGMEWHRYGVDSVGLSVSRHGWDSEMIEYPFVFDHDGARFMLYNGNGYGETGFGLAVLD